jgi:hypothetical protein
MYLEECSLMLKDLLHILMHWRVPWVSSHFQSMSYIFGGNMDPLARFTCKITLMKRSPTLLGVEEFYGLLDGQRIYEEERPIIK